ncbi:hypothetical protein PLESTB_000782300 [Pleodorina starrii]|uniref:Uncharacterized protein n=1 Tax=Pleodorina starrii TaxID=330485 RepID=A0A9W6BK60_9CHLO|nr:hypothetical protein PLESTM_000502600 [Pleodorina starrii]GLC53741.1 hypothetical protein PLESTB_000782300 [Pleodorina starrii]GLC72921.1 hypothetical protein PLESTF_001309900 [Pleodorina starrii]
MRNSMQLGGGLPCKAHSSVVASARRPIHRRGTVTCASAENAPTTSRRSVLALIGSLGASTASGALADPPPPTQGEPAPAIAFPVAAPAPAPQPNDPTIFNYDFVSDVPSNLRVREYWSIINQTRPRTWQLIAQQIQTGSYAILAIDLNLAPMADLRHAALHLPWALLQNYDYNAATDAMKAYKNLEEHIKDLERAATAAAALPPADAVSSPQAQQVQQAFILMSASLDGYLATVPTRYTTATLNLFGRGGNNGNGNGASSPAPAPAPPAPAAPAPVVEEAVAAVVEQS